MDWIPLDAETLSWQTFLAVGLLPPLAVWLLWRAQRLCVEVLRFAMVKLVRRAKWLYTTASWIGTLLHEVSHALVLLATGLGIRDFSVRAEQGHVTPRRQPRTAFGAVALMVAALAPMWFVPAILLAAAILLLDPDLLAWGTPAFGVEAMDAMTDSILGFPVAFAQAVAGIDLVDWRHALFVFLVLVGAPGTRPSFIKGEGLLGGQGDLGVVRGQIKRRPWLFFLVPALVLVGYYVLIPIYPAAYWWPFQALWATALTGIVTALLAALVWGTVARNTRIALWIGWVPPALLIGVQVAGRQLPDLAAGDLAWVNGVSLAAWVASAWALSLAVPRRDAIDRAILGS